MPHFRFVFSFLTLKVDAQRHRVLLANKTVVEKSPTAQTNCPGDASNYNPGMTGV
jgi:hypothetical protein